jgi:DNA-directed RNA polymerase specialized sigma24 family protein
MSAAMPSSEPPLEHQPLGDPALRRSLEDFVRRRVPAADVDDVVQTVLCDALAAEGRPRDPGELRRWLLGIARHKVADLHRRAHREPPAELPDLEANPPPVEARDLLRWADQQAGSTRDAKQTLDWMTREGDGEKLESIAASEQVPAARVRQRVSRMRRWMKERWAAELGAAAVIFTLALVAWWLFRRPNDDTPVAKPDHKPPPSATALAPSPLEQARALRDKALDDCAQAAWGACLDGLDKARALDPEGDKAPRVGDARKRAEEALRSPPPFDEKKPTDPKEKLRPVPTSIPMPPKFIPTTIPSLNPTAAPRTKKADPVKPTPFLEGKSKPPSKGGKSGFSEK